MANGEEKDDPKELKEFGVYLLSDEVDSDSSSEVIEWILEANFNRSHEYLTLILNSPGGYVMDGIAIIDVMAGSKVPIRTVGVGMIASMALSIFVAGAHGHRILTPNTFVLSHQWSGFAYGKEHELVAAHRHHGHLTDWFFRHFRRHTGLTEAKIRKVLVPASDVWLTANEALEMGLCDEVKCV